MSESQACLGCCLNPLWVGPTPPSPLPEYFAYQQYNPPYNPPIPEIHPTYYDSPSTVTIDLNGHLKLTPEEQVLLAELLDAWNNFVKLDKTSGDDLEEFRDAIHRCQQIIALRVARRVNPEVWHQP